MTAVARHKTAIARQHLSSPLQAVARYGLLDGTPSIFDYGCGRGDDVSALQTAGYDAAGWDPHYFADAPVREADIVNLGYVLNVIEEPEERVETAKKAFDLARQCLVVSVLVVGQGDTSALKPHGDGHLTRTGTFQKYFTQPEASDLIQEALGNEPIAVAPGIFFVFRDKVLEQRFLASRHRRARDISHLLHIVTPSSAEATSSDRERVEEHRALLQKLWEVMLELGRLPAAEELDNELSGEVICTLGSIREAGRLAQLAFESSSLKEARNARIADLKVYFALNLFNKRKAYQELPAELRRDIKAFFGSHRNAEEAGREVLLSLSDPETILERCQEAANQGTGYLDGDHSLQLHVDLIERLSPELRAYVGCAEKLYGDVSQADLVKIHIQSGKLTLIKCEKFKQIAIPRITERIKIKMVDRDIDFFEYPDKKTAPRVYLKSRFMAEDQDGFAEQVAFDQKLKHLAVFDFSDFGPTVDELLRGLKQQGLAVQGFDLVPREKVVGRR